MLITCSCEASKLRLESLNPIASVEVELWFNEAKINADKS